MITLLKIKGKLHGKKGFTLIEMIMCIVIISILAGLGMTSGAKYVDESKITKAQAEVATMEIAVSQYNIDNPTAKISIINESISQIDVKTQDNVKIATETNIVAQQTNDIAGLIVEDASGKRFEGKNDIKIRKNIIDPNYTGEERRRIERLIKDGQL